MAERWLPVIQKSFNVMPIHECIGEAHPYWEKQWVYPTLENPQTKKPSDSDENKDAGDSTFVRNPNDLDHNKEDYNPGKSTSSMATNLQSSFTHVMVFISGCLFCIYHFILSD